MRYFIHESTEDEHKSLIESMRPFLHNENPKTGKFCWDDDKQELSDNGQYCGEVTREGDIFYIHIGDWIYNLKDSGKFFDEIEKEFDISNENVEVVKDL